MLGKDFKKLISLYRDTIIENNSNIEELVLVDERVLEELIKDLDEEANLISEELLNMLYEVIFMDIEDAVKIKAIEVMKTLPISVSRVLCKHLEDLYGMTIYNNPNLLVFLENIKVIKDENALEFNLKLEEFILGWKSYVGSLNDGEYHYEDFSFARKDFVPLIDYLTIKGAIYNKEDVHIVSTFEKNLENKLLFFSHHKDDDESEMNENEFYKILREYIEGTYGDVPQECDRSIFNSISMFVPGFQSKNLKTYLDFVNLFYFDDIQDDYAKLLVCVEKRLNDSKDITSYKLSLINEIMHNLNCDIDCFNDTRFIMRLLDLTMSDLEKIKVFAGLINRDDTFDSEYYPYMIDKGMIEMFPLISEFISKNIDGPERVVDYTGSVIEKIEEGLSEGNIEEVMSEEIDDDTDYSLVTLRLNIGKRKQKKKKLFF